MDKRAMELKDTIPMMESADYKERFKAEVIQIGIRTCKLEAMLSSWAAGELKFQPTCPYDLLEAQLNSMKEYLRVLGERARIECIELDNIQTTSVMTFGDAIKALKHGKRLARKGWNGKGMFIVYQKGYPDGIPCNKQTAEAYGYEEGTLFKCSPYIQMRCADGTHQMWTASQTDILAEDWEVVV